MYIIFLQIKIITEVELFNSTLKNENKMYGSVEYNVSEKSYFLCLEAEICPIQI